MTLTQKEAEDILNFLQELKSVYIDLFEEDLEGEFGDKLEQYIQKFKKALEEGQ